MVETEQKKKAQGHSADFSPTDYPVIRDESWLANELLLLDEAETQNLPVRQFKCKSCHCVNSYLADSDRADQIMRSGRMMMHRHNCINRGCYCHTACGKPTQIATRVMDWGDVPFE